MNMKVKKLILFAVMLLLATTAGADNNDEAKKKINSIKKDSQYLYAEATAPTEQEAHDIAEEMLYEEINAWAASRKKLQKSSSLAVNNTQSLWTTMSLPRGNMIRSFIYVKKSDILPVENSEVIDNKNVLSNEQPEIESTIEEILPDAVATLAKCTEYSDLATKIKQLKNEGKLKSYARYAQLDNPEACYLAIYNKAGKVVALLSPGTTRHNISTGKADSVTNYSGCGAIGFIVNE